MGRLSPTQRTLRALRDRGLPCGIVERFNQYAGPHGRRQDLFGFIDIIAIDVDTILAVQSCGQSFAAHDRKIREECAEHARAWVAAGGALELWGWRRIKVKRGGTAKRWAPRVKKYTLEDFA